SGSSIFISFIQLDPAMLSRLRIHAVAAIRTDYAAPRTRRLRPSACDRGRACVRGRFGTARAPPRALETWLAVRATVRPSVSISDEASPARSPATLIAASAPPSPPRLG